MYFSLISEISLMNKTSFHSFGFLQTSELQISNYSLPCLSIVTKSIAASTKSVAAKELNANNFEIYNATVLQLQSTIFVFS